MYPGPNHEETPEDRNVEAMRASIKRDHDHLKMVRLHLEAVREELWKLTMTSRAGDRAVDEIDQFLEDSMREIDHLPMLASIGDRDDVLDSER